MLFAMLQSEWNTGKQNISLFELKQNWKGGPTHGILQHMLYVVCLSVQLPEVENKNVLMGKI